MLFIRTNVWYSMNIGTNVLLKGGIIMMTCQNIRFIERNFLFTKIMNENNHLSYAQIEKLLDEASEQYVDYTFKFYENGSVVIIDNCTNLFLKPKDLKDVALDFYIRKRIAIIKESLHVQELQYA